MALRQVDEMPLLETNSASGAPAGRRNSEAKTRNREYLKGHGGPNFALILSQRKDLHAKIKMVNAWFKAEGETRLSLNHMLLNFIEDEIDSVIEQQVEDEWADDYWREERE